MDLQRSIFDDESGVSPVIGVILMVAVTVIIAAVIGSTALGLGNQVSESPPQAQFEVTETIENYEIERADDPDQTRYYGKALVLQHTSGENVDPTNIKITVDGEPVYSYGTYPGGEIGAGGHAQVTYPFQEATGDIRRLDGKISAGDETVLIWYGSYADGYTIDPQANDEDTNTIDYATWRSGDSSLFYDGGLFGSAGSDRYNDFEQGDTVKIIWESGDQSQTLFEHEVH